MTIREILDHEWFLLMDKNESNVLRNKTDKNGKSAFELYSTNTS